MRAGRPVRIEDVAESLAGALVDAGLSVGDRLGRRGADRRRRASRGATSSVAMATGAPLPDRVEERLAEITELVATAIASSANREQLARLADEQAALRRVATLVARGAPPAEVFDAVAEELGRLLDAASSGLVRFEDENTAQPSSPAGAGSARWVTTGARLPIGGRERHNEDREDRPAGADRR